MRFSLAKLIKKPALAPALQHLLASLETPLRIEDAHGTPLLAAGNGGEYAARYPVSVDGETIGWVSGDEKAAAVAALLAAMAESETEKRTLAAETLNKYKEITLLYDMVEKVSSSLDSREIARLVIEEARRVITLTSVSVLLLNRESGLLELVADYRDRLEDAATGMPATGIGNHVLLSGRAEMVDNAAADPRFAGGETPPAVSLMCAPLKAKDAVVGIIEIGNREPFAYTSEDLKLFTTLASLTSIAMENAGLYEQLTETFYTTIYTLAETIEKRDPYTGNHTKRVVEYSLAIGTELGLSEVEMARLRLGAALHDIGKIGVRDNVLLKPSALTDEEFEQIKLHPLYGEEIIGSIAQLAGAVPGVKQHHEKYNGKGYPLGLKGEEIDVTARIIAVADTFDAMTSNRPYRAGLSLDEAFEELRRFSGSQFDPQVVEAFFNSDVMEAFFAANARSKIL